MGRNDNRMWFSLIVILDIDNFFFVILMKVWEIGIVFIVDVRLCLVKFLINRYILLEGFFLYNKILLLNCVFG